MVQVPTVEGLAFLCDPVMHTKRVITDSQHIWPRDVHTGSIRAAPSKWQSHTTAALVAGLDNILLGTVLAVPSRTCTCSLRARSANSIASLSRFGGMVPPLLTAEVSLIGFSLTPIIVWHSVAPELYTHLRTSTGKCASARPETICCRAAAVHWR